MVENEKNHGGLGKVYGDKATSVGRLRLDGKNPPHECAFWQAACLAYKITATLNVHLANQILGTTFGDRSPGGLAGRMPCHGRDGCGLSGLVPAEDHLETMQVPRTQVPGAKANREQKLWAPTAITATGLLTPRFRLCGIPPAGAT